MDASIPCVFCLSPNTDAAISLGFKEAKERQFKLSEGYKIAIAYMTFYYPCHRRCSIKFRLRRAFQQPLKLFAIVSCILIFVYIIASFFQSPEFGLLYNIELALGVAFFCALFSMVAFGYHMDRRYLREFRECIEKWNAKVQGANLDSQDLKRFGLYSQGLKQETYN